MRAYTFQNQTIEVELRPFGVFLWLLAGFEVRVGGRSFLPKPDGARFNTTTDFEVDVAGSRVPGVVRSLGPMLFLPRMRYSVSIGGSEIARDVQFLRRWYLSYLAWAAVLILVLLALLGALAVGASISALRRPPNQAMQRTAGRSAFPLPMISTSSLQRRALSPAVADLVSR